jgi:hypothetical protein
VYIRAKCCRCGAALACIPAATGPACAVDIVSTKPQMAQVDVTIVRRAQLQFEIGAGVNDHSKALRTELNHHAEGTGQRFDLLVEVRHCQGYVVECRGCCHGGSCLTDGSGRQVLRPIEIVDFPAPLQPKGPADARSARTTPRITVGQRAVDRL